MSNQICLTGCIVGSQYLRRYTGHVFRASSSVYFHHGYFHLSGMSSERSKGGGGVRGGGGGMRGGGGGVRGAGGVRIGGGVRGGGGLGKGGGVGRGLDLFPALGSLPTGPSLELRL